MRSHLLCMFYVYTCKEEKSTLRLSKQRRNADRGRNCTAFVSIDLDRTDNRFPGFDVLKALHCFTFTALRQATGTGNP